MSLSNDGSPPADQSAPAAPASPPPADESVNLEALNQEPSDAAPLDGEVLEPAEDLDDLEYEPGKKYRVPKPVKDGWLRQADYTRKTQEVAEHRKALEAERQAFGQTAASVQQHIEAVADLRVVDRTLKEYENVDWERAWRENPVEAGAAQSRLAALERQRQTLVGTIQQGEQAGNRQTPGGNATVRTEYQGLEPPARRRNLPSRPRHWVHRRRTGVGTEPEGLSADAPGMARLKEIRTAALGFPRPTTGGGHRTSDDRLSRRQQSAPEVEPYRQGYSAGRVRASQEGPGSPLRLFPSNTSAVTAPDPSAAPGPPEGP
jgi:hypothetical protein